MSELSRSASALLEQNEARFGQHALLCAGQAPAGVSLRQVADYLDDLGQITRRQLLQVRLVPGLEFLVGVAVWYAGWVGVEVVVEGGQAGAGEAAGAPVD